jgi:hypothetical protein
METDSQYPMVQRGAQAGAFVLTRRLIFFYFILWVVEGALRKWVMPSLSMPLLVVRDPVVLAIYFFAARAQIFPSNGWMKFLWALALLIAAQAAIHVASGSVTWTVALYGVRCFVLHLPLIWVIPAVFGRKEMITLGKWVLYLAFPMAMLMLIQFRVGGDHWLNAATLKGGSQISAALEGKVRPAGLFSFIAGPIHFYALCTALAIGAFLSTGVLPRWLSIMGLAGTLIAMSVSASRGLVLGCIIVGAFGAFAAFRSGRAMAAAVVFGIAVVGVAGIISRSSTIQQGVFAFQTRWSWQDDDRASGQRAAAERFGGAFISAFRWVGIVPLTGEGVGSGTNLAGSLAGGKDSPVEGEWERVIWELGPITGFLYLGWRTALSGSLIMLGLKGLRAGNYICLPLGAACFIDVLTGFTKQPTSLGYIAMCTGFTLAAARAFSTDDPPTLIRELQADVASVEQPKQRARGRGPFAVGGSPNRL